ncbi:uncharacterized protein AB675_9817 [Cyphellophora attinorum]|uniref:Uncharacterized protein n=1 Tax=Cyphellophora attinorum TaxID=1664694 RepID=A0A0N0NP76_9EURO|nr:uncharacterized protein AB675_9817 [Phialophora attinorum]KPI42431.1 hypothetical protein AB675_9817 [Phialophora attinorum]
MPQLVVEDAKEQSQATNRAPADMIPWTALEKPIPNLAKMPLEIIYQIFDDLIPRNIVVTISDPIPKNIIVTIRERRKTRDLDDGQDYSDQDDLHLYWHDSPLYWTYSPRSQFSKWCLICKDLSSKLGPLIYSRLELAVQLDRVFDGDLISLHFGKESLVDKESPIFLCCLKEGVLDDMENLKTSYDIGLSHLHWILVEKFNKRVGVDDAARDRELGLFRALPAECDVSKDEVVDGRVNGMDEIEAVAKDADVQDDVSSGVASMKLE